TTSSTERPTGGRLRNIEPCLGPPRRASRAVAAGGAGLWLHSFLWRSGSSWLRRDRKSGRNRRIRWYPGFAHDETAPTVPGIPTVCEECARRDCCEKPDSDRQVA